MYGFSLSNLLTTSSLPPSDVQWCALSKRLLAVPHTLFSPQPRKIIVHILILPTPPDLGLPSTRVLVISQLSVITLIFKVMLK
jgi:hypothetical protein